MTIGMIFWLGLLSWVLYLGACWVAYHERHLRFWLAYSIVPCVLIVTAWMLGAPVPRLVVWLYSCSLPVVPLWWMAAAVFRPEELPPARNDFSDLKPLDRERGERW